MGRHERHRRIKVNLHRRYLVRDIWGDRTSNKGVADVRIFVFVALLSATTFPALADQFEWGPSLADQETISTPFGTPAAMIVPSMSCLDNAPLVREAVRYRTSA